jgi:hypothetical protein
MKVGKQNLERTHISQIKGPRKKMPSSGIVECLSNMHRAWVKFDRCKSKRKTEGGKIRGEINSE